MISVAHVDSCCRNDTILIYHICRKPSVESIYDKSQLLWRRFQTNTGILAKAALGSPQPFYQTVLRQTQAWALKTVVGRAQDTPGFFSVVHGLTQ